jgi:signal peptidase I
MKSEPRDLRASWPQAIGSFLFPVFLVLILRWLMFEPFVIPSGSMIPTLLIHDHIFANKLSYGVRVPFGNAFIFQWSHPKRGQVAVFKYPENPDVFYVKRIVAVGGDLVEVRNGILFVNDEIHSQKEADIPEAFAEQSDNFEYFMEQIPGGPEHLVRYLNREASNFSPFKVPENHFFVMGDNRDQSSDSRFWGTVPEGNLVGQAQRVWLSCEETLATAQFLCDPMTIRWDHFLKKIE